MMTTVVLVVDVVLLVVVIVPGFVFVVAVGRGESGGDGDRGHCHGNHDNFVGNYCGIHFMHAMDVIACNFTVTKLFFRD